MGYIRFQYEPRGSLALSFKRTDKAVFALPQLMPSAAGTDSDEESRLSEVERVHLVLLSNEEPIASNIQISVLEDSTTLVGLGQAGVIGAGGALVQADTEGQQVTAIITRTPEIGKLFQVLSDGGLGVQILEKNLPLDVSQLGSSVAYVPSADRSGSGLDTISFLLRDEMGLTSDPANLTFSVTAVHDQPTPGECSTMTQLHQKVSGLSSYEQSAENAWLARTCMGMCPAERIEVEEDGSIFFRLEHASIEDSLAMMDVISVPLFGRFEQVMTSSRN